MVKFEKLTVTPAVGGYVMTRLIKPPGRRTPIKETAIVQDEYEASAVFRDWVGVRSLGEYARIVTVRRTLEKDRRTAVLSVNDTTLGRVTSLTVEGSFYRLYPYLLGLLRRKSKSPSRRNP